MCLAGCRFLLVLLIFHQSDPAHLENSTITDEAVDENGGLRTVTTEKSTTTAPATRNTAIRSSRTASTSKSSAATTIKQDHICYNVSELDDKNCTKFEGDVLIGPGTKFHEGLNRIAEIRGQVTVSETNFTSLENILTALRKVSVEEKRPALRILNNSALTNLTLAKIIECKGEIAVEITDNAALCTLKLIGNYTTKIDNNCELICSGLEELRKKNCSELVADVIVNWETAILPNLKEVTKVRGQVAIGGTQLTNLKRILGKVESISTNKTEPALIIQNNSALISFNLDSLKKVESKGPVKLKIIENLKKLNSAEVNELRGRLQLNEVEYNFEVAAPAEKQLKSKALTKIIVGSVLGVVMALIVIAIVVAMVVVFCWKKSREYDPESAGSDERTSLMKSSTRSADRTPVTTPASPSTSPKEKII